MVAATAADLAYGGDTFSAAIAPLRYLEPGDAADDDSKPPDEARRKENPREQPNHEVRASTRSVSYSTPKGLLAQTRARDRYPVIDSAALRAQDARRFGRAMLAVASEPR